jgi:3'(2'), 5'-bisphosphate nucleotidase
MEYIFNIFACMKKSYALAIKAAIKAGQAILDIYGTDDFQVESKADDSPLTIADKTANGIITEILEKTDFPILSEEGKTILFEDRKGWDKFWLVDPLDGTKEFIKRNGEFTVNIALVEEGCAEFGVVYAPVIQELYLGIPGRGAFLCREEKNFNQPLDYLLQFSEPMPVEQPDEQHFRVVASRSHYNDDTKAFVESLDSGGKEISLVSKGSSLKLCMVAVGSADIYPRLGPTMEWDTAAAHAVVKASGKNVYHAETGKELEYNKENLLNPYFVVK